MVSFQGAFRHLCFHLEKCIGQYLPPHRFSSHGREHRSKSNSPPSWHLETASRSQNSHSALIFGGHCTRESEDAIMSLGFESDVSLWSLVWCPYLQRCCPTWNLCCTHGDPHTPQEAGHFLHPLQPGPQRHPGPSNAGVPSSLFNLYVFLTASSLTWSLTSGSQVIFSPNGTITLFHAFSLSLPYGVLPSAPLAHRLCK